MNLVPCSIVPILAIVIVHRRPGRKMARQHSPGAACAHQIQDAVNHLAQISAAGPPTSFGRWQQWFNQFPLFICQIAWVVFIVHTSVIGQNTTFHTLLEDFEKSGKKALSRRKRDVMNYHPAALTTLRMIEDLLGPKELSILRLACFFSPEPIPVAIFETQPEKICRAAWLLPREMRAEFQSCGGEGTFDFRGLLSELAKWSLITLTDESFTIHRMVQECIIRGIAEDKRKVWAELALHLMDGYICSAPRPDDIQGRALWDSIESHIRVLVSRADDFDIPEPTSRLINELGVYLKSRGRFSEAELLYLWALEIDEKWFGAEHSKVAVRLNNLGQLLEVTNRFEQAEFLMQRGLEIDEKWFGPDHPQISSDLNNLGQLLKRMNRLREAELLMCPALEIDEKSFGPNHPVVAVRLNNLAQLLMATNRLREAELLMRRALEIDEKLSGPTHPKVAIRLNNLAGLLEGTNRLEQVEPLMRRAVKILENHEGEPPGSYAAALNNLAHLLKATNRFEEAGSLMRRALEIDEGLFGPNHPNVAVDLNNLAELLKDTKHIRKARPLMRRALQILEDSLGPEHPKSKVVQRNLEALK